MDTSLASADGSWLGEAESDHLGESLCGAGDVNGDGFHDFLMGSTYNDDAGDNGGKAYLVFGRAEGWLPGSSAADADASFLGGQEGDHAGTVGAAGDVNGDGYSDFLVGADGVQDSRGRAYLFLGREDGWGPDQSLALADASFLGETVDDYAGMRLSGVGDVNGDGLDDFAVGAPGTWGAYESRGKVYLQFGKTTGWTMGQNLADADASFDPGFDSQGKGIALFAGDVDGDGFDDFVPWDSYDEDGDQHEGVLSFLFLGQDDAWGHDVDYFQADTAFLAAGCGSAGDVNGDGRVDLTCYADQDYSHGRTLLYLDIPAVLDNEVGIGGADASYLGEFPDDLARPSSGRGDVNGDGFDDLLFGAHGNDEGANGAGQIYLVLGRSVGWSAGVLLTDADASWQGQMGDYAGDPSAIIGDVNADGFDDILVGAPSNNDIAPSAGKVYLILGESHPLCPGDKDSDGYADPGHPDCPNGEETDCNDSDPWVNPGVDEDCADSIDNDCDGEVDGDDADCPSDDDDSADDDTTGDDDTDDDTNDPDDDDCQCRNQHGPVGSPLAFLGLITLVLCRRRVR